MAGDASAKQLNDQVCVAQRGIPPIQEAGTEGIQEAQAAVRYRRSYDIPLGVDLQSSVTLDLGGAVLVHVVNQLSEERKRRITQRLRIASAGGGGLQGTDEQARGVPLTGAAADTADLDNAGVPSSV